MMIFSRFASPGAAANVSTSSCHMVAKTDLCHHLKSRVFTLILSM